MDNLRHLMTAYFHQDWWDEYGGSWSAGVSDFARRSPDRVPGLITEITALLESDPSEADAAGLLKELGNYRAPTTSPTAHLDWLHSILDMLAPGAADADADADAADH